MTTAGRRAPRPYLLAVAVAAVAAVLALASGGSPSSATPRSASPRHPAQAAVVKVRHQVPAGHRAATHPSNSAKYGGLPSWLPKPTEPVGRVVTASAAHPALAIQGDTVRVVLTHGRTTATVVGPVVPEEGTFPVPATSPCRFTISLAAGAGVVPIRAGDFTILEEQGHIHHPRVSLRGGGSSPARLGPRRIVTLNASAVLPTGNGRLRWAPSGPRPLVSWDFDVEID